MMEIFRKRRFVVSVTAGLLLGLLPTAAAAAPESPESTAPTTKAGPLAGLRVMLTNDDSVQNSKSDGSDGRGLFILRKALCASGADVVVVGPWTGQSGASRGSATSPTATIAAPLAIAPEFAGDCGSAPAKGAVFGVCQGSSPCTAGSATVTPADTVDLALSGMLAKRFGWTSGPGLVVSGSNTGANIGLAMNPSGTVGAATAAIERNIPAVSVSTGSGGLEVPSTAGFIATATVATSKIATLYLKKLLPKLVTGHYLISVAHPDVKSAGTQVPVVWTSVDTIRLYELRYSETASGGNTFQLGYAAVSPAPTVRAGTDTSAILGGKAAISAVSIDRDAKLASNDPVRVALTGN